MKKQLGYFVTGVLAYVINLGLVVAMVEWMGMTYVYAISISSVIIFLGKYLVYDRMVFA